MDFRMVVLDHRTLSSFCSWLLPLDVVDLSSLEEDKALAVYVRDCFSLNSSVPVIYRF